jgi:hypothetical protein
MGMNKQFVKKMVQAKRLEYQALKEVMPECMAKRVTKLESELLDFGKEFVMTIMSDSEKNDSSDEASGSKQRTRKVPIE